MSVRSSVDAAALNERITFQRRVITQDSQGRKQESFQTLATVWARVDGARVAESRREPAKDGLVRSIGDYQIWIRSDIQMRLSISRADRIVWRGRILDIQDIPDQQLRGNLTGLLCREGANNG